MNIHEVLAYLDEHRWPVTLAGPPSHPELHDAALSFLGLEVPPTRPVPVKLNDYHDEQHRAEHAAIQDTLLARIPGLERPTFSPFLESGHKERHQWELQQIRYLLDTP